MSTPHHPPPAKLSVAPMVDRSDRHFRALMRCITRRTLIYSPMITTHALLHGDAERILAQSPGENPVALQLGGDDPKALARCAKLGVDAGYDEINLNVGCPSSRVQGGNFGAILMRDPARVADCAAAMLDAVDVPVTVKHRIGVDELDRYEDMRRFVDRVAAVGVQRFTVHARKAWLQGLSPKENRTIPPLRHDEVARLKMERPDLFIETNGGVLDLDRVELELGRVDAVMIGRAAWDRPMLFAQADARIFGDRSREAPSPSWVARRFGRYAAAELDAGVRPVGVLRNLLNLFHGRPGARAFKRAVQALAQTPWRGPEAFVDDLEAALMAQARTEAEMAA